MEDERNRKIEQELAADAEKESLIIKLLLLGAGDSGKTTLRKQMRNLFGNGFTKEMREEFSPIILEALSSGFEEVVTAMHGPLGLSLKSPEATNAITIIIENNKAPKKKSQLDDQLVNAMKTLLQDGNFLSAIGRKNEYQLQDCWSTFADELRAYPTWGGPGWVPSIEDCISCRIRTTGIQEEQFTLDNVPFKVFDVGGQRAERRKWIHCFDNVTALIFVAAISEYDQVLFEDRRKNRLEEALDLFEEVNNMKVFERIDTILFLNKRDLFEKKFIVQGVQLDPVRFPGAPVHDIKAALHFLEQLFIARNSRKKKIHVHITVATDPDNIKKVFDSCKNIILAASMNATGFRD